jgi:hypothetical protein
MKPLDFIEDEDHNKILALFGVSVLDKQVDALSYCVISLPNLKQRPLFFNDKQIREIGAKITSAKVGLITMEPIQIILRPQKKTKKVTNG